VESWGVFTVAFVLTYRSPVGCSWLLLGLYCTDDSAYLRVVSSKRSYDDKTCVCMMIISPTVLISVTSAAAYRWIVLFYKMVFNHNIAVSATYILLPVDCRTRAKHQFKYGHITARSSVFKNSFFHRTIVK